MYRPILVTLLTHLELQKAESVCKTIVAINVFEEIVDLKSRTEKRVLLIFIADYSAQEKEIGYGMKKWEGEKGLPFKLGMGPPRA